MKMKILHIAYSLSESSSATRLAKEQAKKNEIFFLLGRLSDDQFVRSRQIHPYLTCMFGIIFHVAYKFYARFYGVNSREVFSIDFWVGIKIFIFKILKRGKVFDVFHLHWGGLGFFPLELIKGVSKNTIITAHDYQFFTGGCHVPMNCKEFESECSNCPLVSSSKIKKIIRNRRKKIQEIIHLSEMSVIAPSIYTKNKISNALPVDRISVIPSTYGECWESPQDQEFGKSDKKNIENIPVLLTVGLKREPRDNKGFYFIRSMIEKLKEDNLKVDYISVGELDKQLKIENHVHYDSLSSIELSNIYRKADLCIVASKYETFSQVTLESIVYGTPVIAFNIGGPTEIIEKDLTGFLIEPFDKDKFFKIMKEKLISKKKLNNDFINGVERAKIAYSPSKICEEVEKHYLKFGKI